jgi:hypothetical protein
VVSSGASRTRTGDLLGAINLEMDELPWLRFVQAILGELRSLKSSQLGSTVSGTGLHGRFSCDP